MLFALLIASCTAIPSGPSAPTPAASPTAEAIATSTPIAEQARPAAQELVLWTLPRFAADPDEAAGGILWERLRSFEEAHPGLHITQRVKAERGEAALLNTLQTAGLAASSALPDLALLGPADLHRAVEGGLILPLDGVLAEPAMAGWYDFGLEATIVEGSHFGLPFASDTTLLAYRSDLYSGPPLTWQALLNSSQPFLFPAGDARADFTLAQYLALDGHLQDSEGRTALQAPVLSQVFAFYRSLSSAGVLPSNVTQQSSANATWDIFRTGSAASAVAPLSGYIHERNPETTAGAPLPSRQAGIALSHTWSWVLAADRPERRELVQDLIRWITDPSFLGEWTYALGMVPPNSASLAAWPENQDLVVVSQLVTVMRASPAEGIIELVGPVLQSSTSDLLLEGISPETAAARAVNMVRTSE
jgi:ABC-type glycerol-3-phosphate transport system substrate-binding protein